MTGDEYYAAVQAANRFDHSDRTDSWNERYVRRLLYRGLVIVPTEPKGGMFMQAPWPTSQDDTSVCNPHTPETDPWAWVIPSWIVPIDYLTKVDS